MRLCSQWGGKFNWNAKRRHYLLSRAWLNPSKNNWYFINKWIILRICDESLESDTSDLKDIFTLIIEMKIKCNFHKRIPDASMAAFPQHLILSPENLLKWRERILFAVVSIGKRLVNELVSEQIKVWKRTFAQSQVTDYFHKISWARTKTEDFVQDWFCVRLNYLCT